MPDVPEEHLKPLIVLNLAGVVVETELVKVPLQMVSADVVVRSADGSLAVVAPKCLNRVRVRSVNGIDAVTVVNHMVLIDFLDNAVPLPVVHVERHA